MSPRIAQALLLGLRAVVPFLLAGCILVFVPAIAAQTNVINVAVLPTTVNVHVPGGMQQFDARVTTARGNRIVHWSLSGPGCTGASCGRLSETTSASGSAITYTAPAKLPIPAKIFLTATSASDRSRKARATITLAGPASASVNPILSTSLLCQPPSGCGADFLEFTYPALQSGDPRSTDSASRTPALAVGSSGDLEFQPGNARQCRND